MDFVDMDIVDLDMVDMDMVDMDMVEMVDVDCQNGPKLCKCKHIFLHFFTLSL